MKLYLTKEEKDKIKNLGILKVSQVAYFLGVRLIKEKKIKREEQIPFNTFKILWN
ncbi:MAG: hypothetical protein ABIK77_02170 [candidate division WOR-3 bacterium]